MGILITFFGVVVGLGVMINVLIFLSDRSDDKKFKENIGGYNEYLRLLESLLLSKKGEWDLKPEKFRMVYKKAPFKKTDILYKPSGKIELQVKGWTIHTIERYGIIKDAKKEVERLFKTELSQEDSKLLDGTLHYLGQMYEQLVNEEKESSSQEKKYKTTELEKELERILESDNSIKEFRDSTIFHIDIEKNHLFTTVTVRLKEKQYCYFQLHYNNKSEKYEITYGVGEEVAFFQSKKYKLELFFLDMIQTEEENLNEEGLREDYRVIKTKMDMLKQKGKWISQESLHYLNETLPKDMLALIDAYMNYEEKDEVENIIKESMETIAVKLSTIEREVKLNQKRLMETQKEVIAKR